MSELPEKVPENLKHMLYVGWVRKSTELGKVPVLKGTKQVDGYGVKPATGIPKKVWRRLLIEAVNPLEGASWARERDPFLQREIIKIFIFEEGGVVLYDSEDV